MSKTPLYILGILFVLLAGYLVFTRTPNTTTPTNTQPSTVSDFKNAEYTIEGQKVMLVNGLSEITPAPGSISKIVTKYFGNEVRADLNEDGREDVVFLLTQNLGGSGTFYYVVAALNMTNGYVGSHGLLLGDRIAPQTTEMSKDAGKVNVIVVNYADRNAGEPMTTRPSLGKSIWLKLDTKTMQFGEVVQNFEGEANPSVMSLPMQKWTWINATYKDGTVVTPSKKEAFTVTFGKNGTFSATTDCNGVGGAYATTSTKISFSKMMSTLMFCEGSQEGAFTKLLSDSDTYKFTSKGELVIGLKLDSGTVIFK